MPAPPSAGAPILGTLALISRLGWKRAGARFQTRGVDDEGNVANFVEVRGIATFWYRTHGALRQKLCLAHLK